MDNTAVELLAELLYQDALLEADLILQNQLLNKSLRVLSHINASSSDYVITRQQRIEEIKRRLDN